ncbi:MAG: DNA repair protein RecO [Candidatus Eisenbacteria bacterium]|uniref:DNA repair protein RecO n=1 Tax=Eiseniibacteriota bacterium TaxID=2212470 RepID=A0A849SCX2_UNCEI|nr:DNA repair protein RecO [Candidatus Eisenbacteria bacterium]
MALTRTEGVVIRAFALGDTSRIVVVYTRDLGLIKLVAKGARKAPSRFGFALEPLSFSRFVLYYKPDRDLQLVSQAETIEAMGSSIGSLERLAHAEAALELIDRLVWGEEPHAELYDLLRATLGQLERAPIGALAAVTLAYQLQVASLLGYRPRLDRCASCGQPISPRRVFSPVRGGMLCDRCAALEAGSILLSADALAGLSLLLTRPVEEAGQFAEVQRAGELLKAVEAFYRHHFQRFQGLRSLEMLKSLRSGEEQ